MASNLWLLVLSLFYHDRSPHVRFYCCDCVRHRSQASTRFAVFSISKQHSSIYKFDNERKKRRKTGKWEFFILKFSLYDKSYISQTKTRCKVNFLKNPNFWTKRIKLSKDVHFKRLHIYDSTWHISKYLCSFKFCSCMRFMKISTKLKSTPFIQSPDIEKSIDID